MEQEESFYKKSVAKGVRKMKRLLCIVGGMNAGGAETYLMKLYRQLNRDLYQMDFAVAVKEECVYDKEILSLGGKIYHICSKTKGILRNFNEIKRIVKENNYNSVLRISQHSLSALELLAARKGGAQIRVFRSSNSNTTSQSKKQKLLHRLCLYMPKHFANVRIAPSTEAATFMFGTNYVKKGKVHILHNALDLNVYKFNAEERIKIRNEFSIVDSVKVIGHVGRFSQQKNHMFLLDVFNEIHKTDPQTVLMLAGKGELEKQIKEKVAAMNLEDSVIFTGIRSDIPALLSAMDVFVFPSFYEGMPNTVIEAQATGLPCLLADTITKEADVTGLVHYMSIKEPVVWAEKALSLISEKRMQTKEIMTEKGYDIKSVCAEFVRLVFDEK